MERERSVSEASIDYRSRSFTEGNRPIVQLSDLPENRSEFQNAKTCISCRYTFGTLLSLVHAEKYCCMFCYNGVCNKCSSNKLLHPETNKLERACTSCYSKLLSQNIHSEMQTDLTRRQTKLKNLMKEVEKEQLIKDAETVEIKALEERVGMRQRQLEEQKVIDSMKVTRYRHDEEELRTALATAQAAHKANEVLIKGLHPKMSEMKQKIEKLKHQEEADQRKWEDLNTRLTEVNTDIDFLKEQLHRDPPNTVPETPDETNPRVLELLQSVVLERDLLVKEQQKNLDLTQKLSKSKKEAMDLSRRRKSFREAELSTDISILPKDSVELKSKLSSLQFQAQQLKSELERVKQGLDDSELRELRGKIMKEKEEGKQLMLQVQAQLLTEGRREAVSRDKCGCRAF